MGNVKRSPELHSRDHRIRYTRMSKADIVEAFRDIFQEYSGDERDDALWLDDLEHRIEILKRYRQSEKAV